MAPNLTQMRHTVAHGLTKPVVESLAKTRVTPNTLTVVGFLATLAAAGMIATDHLLIGGIIILFAGAFDMLDGALARAKKQESHFGSFLDSTLDRLSEAFLLMGLLILCLRQNLTLESLLVYIVFMGSMMVSYVRAKAESLGLECEVGWFTRPERVIVLALGLILNQILIALGILVVFTYITVVQRMVYVRRQTRSNSS